MNSEPQFHLKKHAVFECPVYLEEQEQWLKKNTMYNQAGGLCFVLKKVFDPIAKQLTPIVPFWRVKFDNEEKNEGIFKKNLVHVVKCGLFQKAET